jgi:hypothetical protein
MHKSNISQGCPDGEALRATLENIALVQPWLLDIINKQLSSLKKWCHEFMQ